MGNEQFQNLKHPVNDQLKMTLRHSLWTSSSPKGSFIIKEICPI